MRGIVATSSATRRFWRPNVDICESEDEVLITVELAGVEPETISVHFLTDTNGIVIRGVRTPPDVDNDEMPIKRSHQLEVLYGEFERQITLPNVQTNRKAIRARFVNGMLCIIIPKRNKPLEGRSIPVTGNHG